MSSFSIRIHSSRIRTRAQIKLIKDEFEDLIIWLGSTPLHPMACTRPKNCEFEAKKPNRKF